MKGLASNYRDQVVDSGSASGIEACSLYALVVIAGRSRRLSVGSTYAAYLGEA